MYITITNEQYGYASTAYVTSADIVWEELHNFRIGLSFLLFHYFGTLVLCVGAVSSIPLFVLNPPQKALWLAGLFVVWFLVFAFGFALPHALRLPHTISLDESGRLIFKSLVSQKAFMARDLKSMKANFPNRYYLYFTFSNGKVTVLNSVDGIYQLIQLVKGINPNLQTKRCGS